MDDYDTSSMPRITIFGAGIAGLSLGHCLKKRGIPSLILEKAPSPSYHTYGITLRPWAYEPLADVLGEPVGSFRSFVAVDNHRHNGKGQLPETQSFRAHRGRLEAFLRKGLNIKYKHQLTSVETTSQRTILNFKDNDPIVLDSQKNVIIGADGVHSELRSSVSSSFEIATLPYAVYNGRRKLPKQDFDMYYAPQMGGTNMAETLISIPAHPNFNNQKIKVFLQIYVNDYSPDGQSMNISYTYSRPSFGDSDPLHRPNRSKDEATETPEALFEELKLLKEVGIPHPFSHAFDPARVRKDRILHWLMRSGMMSLEELERCARYNSKPSTSTERGPSLGDQEKGGFLFIGDAIHPTPILGGEGANDAIRDGIELAEYIARHSNRRLGRFYAQRERAGRGGSNESGKGRTRWEVWRDNVDDSERVIGEMHGLTESGKTICHTEQHL